MPSSGRRSLRALLGLVAVGLGSTPAVAAESTDHVDDFWLVGHGPMTAVALLTFAFGLFWVDVLVHVAVPWRRVERFGTREAAVVGGAMTVVALGIVSIADRTMAIGWYPLPAVLGITVVGYASVDGGGRTTLAAVSATLALFLATAAGPGWLLPFDVVGRKGFTWYFHLVLVALLAGCFTHAAGAVVATYRTRTA